MLKFLRNIANTKVNYISEKSSERKSQESNSEKVLDIKQTESSSDEEAEVINNVQDKEENEMQTDETGLLSEQCYVTFTSYYIFRWQKGHYIPNC